MTDIDPDVQTVKDFLSITRRHDDEERETDGAAECCLMTLSRDLDAAWLALGRINARLGTQPSEQDLIDALAGADVERLSEMKPGPFTVPDNLAIALSCYFSGHEDRPGDDLDDEESGLSPWVIDKTDRALSYIVEQIISLVVPEATITRLKREILRQEKQIKVFKGAIKHLLDTEQALEDAVASFRDREKNEGELLDRLGGMEKGEGEAIIREIYGEETKK